MKQRVWTRLSPDEIRAIDDIAAQLHSKRSSVLCLSVERYLSGDQPHPRSIAEGNIVWTRLSEDDVISLDALVHHYGCSRVDLIALAARKLIFDFRK